MILSNTINELENTLYLAIFLLLLLICSIPFIFGIVRNTINITNENKFTLKSKRLKHIIIIIQLVILFTSLAAIVVNSFYVLITYAFAIVTIFLYGKQNKQFNEKNKFKMILIIFEFLLATMMNLTKTDPKSPIDNLGLAATIFFLFTIIFIGIEILQLFTLKPVQNKKIEENKKYFPIGFVSRKQLIVYICFCIILFSTFIIPYLINSSKYDFGDFLLWFVIFTILIYLYNVILQAYVNLKPFKEYMKTLDYQKLANVVNKMLSNNKIHPEYKNYLTMIYLNIVLSHDIDYYNELKETIFQPTNKAYIKSYDLLDVNVLLTKEEYNIKYQEILNKYSKNQAILNRLNNFNSIMDVFHNGNSNVDIDKLVPVREDILHTVMMNKFYKAINAFYIEPEKFEELRKDFIITYPEFKTLIDILESKSV